MIQKAFRPAPTWEGERAGTDHLAWQQISVPNSKTPQLEQQLSVTSYTVDDCLNVIKLNLGPHRREVQQ